jgi:signal transduction histidine kinase
MRPISRQSQIAIVAVTLIAATVITIAAFQYYNATASQITEIARRDIRSNALIEAEATGNGLSNKITDITTNMQVISASQSILDRDIARAQSLFDAAQESTNDITQGYYWLDQNGIIITYSDVNTGKYPEYRGNSLAHRDYYKIPRDEGRLFVTSLRESVDNVTRIYIGYPILNGGGEGSGFLGVIVAAILPTSVGTFMEDQIPPGFESTSGLLDKEGNILYYGNEEIIGFNYFGDDFQTFISSDVRSRLNPFITQSLSSVNAQTQDISVDGGISTVASSPVIIDGQHVFTAYIVYPHNLAGDVGALVDQQRNFSIIAIIVMTGVVALIASLVMSWNKRLQTAVNEKTAELQSAVDSLEKANIRLQEHDKMQQEFINVAAHELRTPIQPLLGASEMMNDEFRRHPDNNKIEIDRETSEILFRNAKRLERLSSDILQVTRIEGNRLQLNKEVFDLNRKVQNVVSDLEATWAYASEGKKVNIRLNLAKQPLNVEADKSKIYEVVANLVANAIKFTIATAASNGEIQIETSMNESEVAKKPAHAVCRIIDNGTGIDPAIMSRLFTKFVTKSNQGTGLGLYISKSIIEAHGGRIWAQNNSNGKGATVAFTLPLADNNKNDDSFLDKTMTATTTTTSNP